MDKPDDHIPPHQSGKAVDVEDSVSFPTEEEAVHFFKVLKKRLLTVHRWHEYAGDGSAVFELTDPEGKPVNRPPQKGDFFKIDIPAPGSQGGEGYDWVQVEEIAEEATGLGEFASIRVRPSGSPLKTSSQVDHFFTDEATSNFIIRREGKKLTAGVYGRNEKPNLAATDNLFDKLRNAVVGAGSIGLFSKLQWKSLVSGWLKK